MLVCVCWEVCVCTYVYWRTCSSDAYVLHIMDKYNQATPLIPPLSFASSKSDGKYFQTIKPTLDARIIITSVQSPLALSAYHHTHILEFVQPFKESGMPPPSRLSLRNLKRNSRNSSCFSISSYNVDAINRKSYQHHRKGIHTSPNNCIHERERGYLFNKCGMIFILWMCKVFGSKGYSPSHLQQIVFFNTHL